MMYILNLILYIIYLIRVNLNGQYNVSVIYIALSVLYYYYVSFVLTYNHHNVMSLARDFPSL